MKNWIIGIVIAVLVLVIVALANSKYHFLTVSKPAAVANVQSATSQNGIAVLMWGDNIRTVEFANPTDLFRFVTANVSAVVLTDGQEITLTIKPEIGGAENLVFADRGSLIAFVAEWSRGAPVRPRSMSVEPVVPATTAAPTPAAAPAPSTTAPLPAPTVTPTAPAPAVEQSALPRPPRQNDLRPTATIVENSNVWGTGGGRYSRNARARARLDSVLYQDDGYGYGFGYVGGSANGQFAPVYQGSDIESVEGGGSVRVIGNDTVTWKYHEKSRVVPRWEYPRVIVYRTVQHQTAVASVHIGGRSSRWYNH